MLHSLVEFVAQGNLLTPPDISPLPTTKADSNLVQTILSIVFTITGAIAVLMVIIGAIKYSSSGGDPSAVSKAKNTIIYAIVGLILSILSVSLVDFVIGKL